MYVQSSCFPQIPNGPLNSFGFSSACWQHNGFNNSSVKWTAYSCMLNNSLWLMHGQKQNLVGIMLSITSMRCPHRSIFSPQIINMWSLFPCLNVIDDCARGLRNRKHVWCFSMPWWNQWLFLLPPNLFQNQITTPCYWWWVVAIYSLIFYAIYSTTTSIIQ